MARAKPIRADHLELLLETVTKKLDRQLESLSSLDTKCTVFLAAMGLIMAGYFQLISADNFTFKDHRYFILSELILFGATFLVIFNAFLLGRSQGWRNDPHPIKLIDWVIENADKTIDRMRAEIVGNMRSAHQKNADLLKEKYDYLRIARTVILIALFVLFAHITFVLFSIQLW